MRHMAEYGDDDARERIASTLFHSQQIMAGRAAMLIGDDSDALPPPGRPVRRVYDARHQQRLPGKLVMGDGKAISTDIEAMEAFDGCGATFDFFKRIFGRNSIDGNGMPLLSTIHYAVAFDNAMWNGKQMVYGDGDGKLFNRFTIDLDIIAHELTHGVTQHDSALEYYGQSGALNEHLSDAFGILVKQWVLGLSASQSDWLIGSGLLASGVHGVAIRSMKAPGTAYNDPVLGRDPQPAHMRNYVTAADDNGGVHVNSGILNHAFYLAAVYIGGNAWLVVGQIWYVVQKTKLFPHAGFQDFAVATIATAGEMYGAGGKVQLAVVRAWSEVGLPTPTSLTRRKRPAARRATLRGQPRRSAIA
jgi:Zn-dependent metalloprotease